MSQSGSWPRSSLASVGNKQPLRDIPSIRVWVSTSAEGQPGLAPAGHRALQVIRVMIIMMMMIMMTLISVMEAVTAQGSSVVSGSKWLVWKNKGFYSSHIQGYSEKYVNIEFVFCPNNAAPKCICFSLCKKMMTKFLSSC